MTPETKDLQKKGGAERISERHVFAPLTDIFETKEAIVVLADLPGVDEKDLDITLEKNVLTIRGPVREVRGREGYLSAHVEYQVGDFERTFTLSEEIDRDAISAHLKNGLLRLHLPKAREQQPRKIAVKAA